MSRLVLRHASLFLVAGLAQVAVDWAVFAALHAAFGWTIAANVAGRVAGALVGFALNGGVTFADADGTRLGGRRFSRFAVLWLAMTATSSLALVAARSAFGDDALYLAKLVIEGVLAAISFVVSRHWVFTR